MADLIRRTVVLLAFILPCALAQTVNDRIGPIVAALQNKEVEKALDLLRPALREFSGNAQLWAMQGAAYSGEGRTKEAMGSFRNALKISPDYLPALQGLGQLEYDAGTPAAIPLIEHVLRLRPADSTSHAMLAVLEYQQGNCTAAVPHFEKAEVLLDSQTDALHAYATCLVRLKEFDRAAEVFERSVALNPDSARERHLLAAIQVMANKPSLALDTLKPLLQTDNPDAGTLELAATAYEDTKDTTQAVNLLRRAILLEPQNVHLYLDFANVSYTHGSFQVGVDVMNDGISLQPASAALYFVRGVLYVQMAQYEKAEADFARAYELDPSQSLSAAAQGMAAAQENDFDRALGKVQASLARKPNDPLLLYLQADILAERQADPGTPEFQLAMRSARKAVSLQPALGAAHGVLAKLDLESGNYQEAAVECRKALASNPKDQVALYHLILALRKAGEKDEIPDLLKRLAVLRREAAKEESDRYRYRLVESDSTQ